jgi:hypothetical protein
MLKPLLTALLCCLFSGCAAFTTSQTWQKVMHVRPDSYSDQTDTSDAYAAKLHGVLKAASVEHKVVTYEYHYSTSLREEAVGTHTAVVYRDDIDQKNPWWLMEDRLSKPVWVSGENLEDQVAFYVRHHVDVVNEKDFPANGDDHKTTVTMATGSTNGDGHGVASHPGHLKAQPSSNYFELAAALPKTASAAKKDSPKTNSYAALFRSVHGSTYDASSSVDRRKMAMLQHDNSRHRQPLASQTL